MRRHLLRLLWPAIFSATNRTGSAKELRQIILIIDCHHIVRLAPPFGHCTKVQYLSPEKTTNLIRARAEFTVTARVDLFEHRGKESPWSEAAARRATTSKKRRYPRRT